MTKLRGYTLVELLFTTAVLSAMLALLLPAIQESRESARACSCRENLREIGIAILHYETTNGHFPMGAEGKFDRKMWPAKTYGFSWWPRVLPYLEQQEVTDQLDHTGVSTGWVQQNERNGRVSDQFAPAFWFCPASSIDKFVTVGGFRLAAPAYAGISGATSHEGFPESRVSECCRSNGEISAGGMLVPNAEISAKQVADGLSNTLLVGEQSDFAIKSDGTPWRIDPAFPNGWLCGTTELSKPPKWSSPLSVAYNLATIRYPLNEKRYDLPGIYLDRGANNPLLSSHDGIVNLLFGDGSVCACSDAIDTMLLKRLATRDEGITAEH